MTTVQEPFAGPCSPPPRSAPLDPLLNEDHNNPNPSAPDPARCRYLSYDKRQCRMLRAGHHPDFCLYHAARQEEIYALLPEREFALAPELENLCADLTTATAVNRALGQVFRLLAQNRITRKDAVAFGYLAQLLLQTVPGVRSEAVAAFGYRQWEQTLRSTLKPQLMDSAASAAYDPQATPLTLSSRPTARVYAPAANVYPQDELRGADKDELSPLTKVQRESKGAAGLVAPDPQATPSTLPSREPGSPAHTVFVCAGAGSEGSLSSGPIPEKASPRDTHSANPVDSAGPPNASANSAFSPPNYADLLSRSLDLFDQKYDATPEGRREARALLLELELMTPRQPKPPSKRLGVPYEPFPKPKGSRANLIEHLRRLRAESTANASQSTVVQNASASPVECALTDH